jgi:hypothetical protein
MATVIRPLRAAAQSHTKLTRRVCRGASHHRDVTLPSRHLRVRSVDRRMGDVVQTKVSAQLAAVVDGVVHEQHAQCGSTRKRGHDSLAAAQWKVSPSLLSSRPWMSAREAAALASKVFSSSSALS